MHTCSLICYEIMHCWIKDCCVVGFENEVNKTVRSTVQLIPVSIHDHANLAPVLRQVADLNILRPRQNGRRFSDDVFKCISLNENVWILIKISLKFVSEGQVNNIQALVRVMAWRRSGEKPLSEPMMVSLPTHICVNRSQWIKIVRRKKNWIIFVRA